MLNIISIIIHICVLRALKKTSNTTISKQIGTVVENIADTAATVLGKLNLSGLGDVVGLIKDLITPIPQDDKTGAQNGK